MKINEDCVRSVLSYFVDNLALKLSDTKGDFDKISMMKVMKDFGGTYSKEDIWYTIYNLSKEGYIETNNIREQSRNGFAYVDIFNVTHIGHQFYESIQPDTIWDKTKAVINKVGVHSIRFVANVAHDIAVESAKQATTIIMCK